MQSLPDVPRDALGYPVDYFERTYGSLVDTPLMRPKQLPLPERNPMDV